MAIPESSAPRADLFPTTFSVMPLRLPRVIVRVGAGPAWTSGPPEDQPGWDAHAEFIDDLIERGHFILGGPWTNRLGSISIWEGMNAGEVREVIQDDPFVRNGVFEIEDIADWTVYVDTRVG
jgi:uncharacterized protein YciI